MSVDALFVETTSMSTILTLVNIDTLALNSVPGCASTVAFEGPNCIDTVLTVRTVMVRIGMVALANVNANVVVDLLETSQALTSVITLWIGHTEWGNRITACR